MFNNGLSRGLAPQPLPAPQTAVDGHNDTMAATIELAQPLASPRGAIPVLTIRIPTYGDWMDCGPVQRNIAIDPTAGSGMKIEVIEDREAMMRWMCRLTGQAEAVLRTMGPRDAKAVRREIARLVAEFEAGNSTGGSENSPSGAM